jgi:hypothetical protein
MFDIFGQQKLPNLLYVMSVAVFIASEETILLLYHVGLLWDPVFQPKLLF